MEISELLKEGRNIWSKKRMPLSQIIVCMGKIFGDICRWERNAISDKKIHSKNELKKELGNIIFSTIRWCDDLGLNPEECVKKAMEAQKKFKK